MRLNRKKHLPEIILGIGLIILIPIAICTGAVSISLLETISIITNRLGWDIGIPFDEQQQWTLLMLRIPRVGFALIIGAGLAIAGTTTQGLFRNPLAEPSLIGVTSGASLGAVIALMGGYRLEGYIPAPLVSFVLTPLCSFLGGIGATVLAYAVAWQSGRVSVLLMLLGGVAINALTFALIGIGLYFSNDTQMRGITYWMLGSLGGATPLKLLIVCGCLIPSFMVLFHYRKVLDLFLLGESEAYHAGIEVERIKRILIVFSAVIVGVCVSFSGTIGFIGLVAPHLMRLLVGASHQRLFWCAPPAGAFLLLLADLLARTLVSPVELPVGTLTAIIGGPFLIALLIREKKRFF